MENPRRLREMLRLHGGLEYSGSTLQRPQSEPGGPLACRITYNVGACCWRRKTANASSSMNCSRPSRCTTGTSSRRTVWSARASCYNWTPVTFCCWIAACIATAAATSCPGWPASAARRCCSWPTNRRRRSPTPCAIARITGCRARRLDAMPRCWRSCSGRRPSSAICSGAARRPTRRSKTPAGKSAAW